jgi:hypothetical protein
MNCTNNAQRVGKTWMNDINKDQIKIIHTLTSKMKLPDEHYRDMLASYKVNSSKDLSFEQAVKFIQSLVKVAEKKGVYVKKQPEFSNLGDRNDYAYPAQLRKIKAMWSAVSRMETSKQKADALNSFLKNKFKIERIEWLPREMVGRVIKSISSIKKDKV